ncbi:hypothetical protein PR048_019289 [Dryococelus australis]|uniref:Uncharacterized protein n=1 Tax=Dryococelus australis TaxID=614101 RepID=A0ABQ9H347_9NEOP|nr:hypothetical protein PR048_019289 [Dryococelus australis]
MTSSQRKEAKINATGDQIPSPNLARPHILAPLYHRGSEILVLGNQACGLAGILSIPLVPIQGTTGAGCRSLPGLSSRVGISPDLLHHTVSTTTSTSPTAMIGHHREPHGGANRSSLVARANERAKVFTPVRVFAVRPAECEPTNKRESERERETAKGGIKRSWMMGPLQTRGTRREPMRAKRGEYGAALECKGRRNERSPRKPTDQRHRPAEMICYRFSSFVRDFRGHVRSPGWAAAFDIVVTWMDFSSSSEYQHFTRSLPARLASARPLVLLNTCQRWVQSLARGRIDTVPEGDHPANCLYFNYWNEDAGEICADLNIEVLRADEGDGWGKRKIPEETRRPAASSGMIPTCENLGAIPLGIEPGSPGGEGDNSDNTTVAPLSKRTVSTFDDEKRWDRQVPQCRAHEERHRLYTQCSELTCRVLIVSTPSNFRPRDQVAGNCVTRRHRFGVRTHQDEPPRSPSTVLRSSDETHKCLPELVAAARENSHANRVRFLAESLSRFSHVGIVSDDATGRWVFSEISRFPRPCIPVLLRTHLTSPSSALETSMLSAAQIPPPHLKFSNRTNNLVLSRHGSQLNAHESSAPANSFSNNTCTDINLQMSHFPPMLWLISGANVGGKSPDSLPVRQEFKSRSFSKKRDNPTDLAWERMTLKMAVVAISVVYCCARRGIRDSGIKSLDLVVVTELEPLGVRFNDNIASQSVRGFVINRRRGCVCKSYHQTDYHPKLMLRILPRFSGFESRVKAHHPVFGFPRFPAITPDELWGGTLVQEGPRLLLARSPPTKANWVQSPAGSPDVRKWE